MQYDAKTGQFIASGHVKVNHENFQLVSDILRYDQKMEMIHAVGNVVVESESNVLKGSEMILHIKDETGVISDGKIYMNDPWFVITAEKFQKTGENTFEAENIGVTSCEGENPDWRITGKRLDLTIEGYGTIRHAMFRIKNAPVLYTPYFLFPAKRKRQSGFLVPRIGHSGRKGIYFDIPFFWAVNDHSDATFYLNAMTRRGVKAGVECRYKLSRFSQGAFMFDYLKDDKTDGGSSEWGYGHDELPRLNDDRYWFRMKHDQALPGEFIAGIDIDIMSDQDYLRDFSGGYNGLEDTRSYFEKTFSRGIDDEDAYIRENRFNVSGGLFGHGVHSGIKWYDDARDLESDGRGEDMIHKAPYITIKGIKRPIAGSPLFFSTEFLYDRFYSETERRAHRLDIAPMLTLPLKFDKYFTVESSVAARERIWFIDKTVEGDNKQENRETFEYSIGAFSELYKVYTANSSDENQTIHTIRPQIDYTYVPDSGEDDFPYFDPSDRAGKVNELAFSLENGLRIWEKSPGALNIAGRKTLRFKLSQSVDLEDDKNESNRFKPLEIELGAAPAEGVVVSGDAGWSHDKGEFAFGNVLFGFKSARGDNYLLEYRYSDNLNEYLTAAASLKLGRRITVKGGYECNIAKDREIRNMLGFDYVSGCWSIGLAHTREDDDHKYEFVISLTGLGEISGSQ